MVDADQDLSGEGKCRSAIGDDKEGVVVVPDKLESSIINYHLYVYPSFLKPSLWHNPPLISCAPPLSPCTHIPVPLTLNNIEPSLVPAPLVLDNQSPVTLDALSPMLAPSTALTALFSIYLSVLYPLGDRHTTPLALPSSSLSCMHLPTLDLLMSVQKSPLLDLTNSYPPPSTLELPL